VFEYGRTLGSWEFTEEGYLQMRCQADGTNQSVTLTSDINLGAEGPRALGRTMIKDGEKRFVALSWHTGQPPRTSDEAERRLIWTAHHWQHWLARGTFPDHPWRSILQRAALTLKGLTYAPSGAIVAAPTTSLPETDGSGTGTIATPGCGLGLCPVGPHLGFNWEANDYLHWLMSLGPRASSRSCTRRWRACRRRRWTLRLPGPPGPGGNAAYGQRQHDVWG
jgi:hypothetical protein